MKTEFMSPLTLRYEIIKLSEVNTTQNICGITMLPVSSVEFHKTIPHAYDLGIFWPCISAVTNSFVLLQTGDATFWHDNNLNKDDVKTL